MHCCMHPYYPPPKSSTPKFTFKNPRSQEFSLSFSILNYIINASPKTWLKLIQTCKFCYSKNAVFPVGSLKAYYSSPKLYTIGEVFDSRKPGPKLWLYGTLIIWYDTKLPAISSSLIPKLYKCDLNILEICNQDLAWNDYQFLTSSGSFTRLDLNNSLIKFDNGSMVTLDKLLENIQYLETFSMHCRPSMFKQDTVTKVVEILQRYRNIPFVNFRLYKLSETFDFLTMTNFILKNENRHLILSYDNEVPLSNAYKAVVDECIEKILANSPSKIPYIRYPEFDGFLFVMYERLRLSKYT